MFKFLSGWHPASYMIMAVASYSVIPVLFHLGDAASPPFLFTGIYQISLGVGLGSLLLLVNRKLLLAKAVTEDIKSHFNWKSLIMAVKDKDRESRRKTWLMLAASLGSFGYVMFALGLSLVDVSIAAILYETWPVYLVLLMAYLFKDSARYKPISAEMLLFFLMALGGVSLVILSHSDVDQLLLELSDVFGNPGILFGAFLVVASAFCWAILAAGSLKMGDLLSDTHSNDEKQKAANAFVFANYTACICSAIAGFVLLVAGLIIQENISLHHITYAILTGFVVTSFGTLSFRAANLSTDDLGVNAFTFATPLATLIWLWVLSILDVPHPDYLTIGAMGIVAANLLINVDASKRIAYKALVASLWLFGTIAYFTEGYATNVPLELPVTVFILVLAFRVDRLVRRTGHEEEWVFEVFHKLSILESEAEEGTKGRDGRKALQLAAQSLLQIDKYRTTHGLTEAYEQMVDNLERAASAGISRREIVEIRRLVDNLAHSRQQGSRFGEFVAIAMTGLLIVTGLLFFNGERELYGEITSFLLSSVVVFLLFNIMDLQKDRQDETLKNKGGRYLVNFDSVKNRRKQQYISMVTSAVIVAVFVVLFITGA